MLKSFSFLIFLLFVPLIIAYSPSTPPISSDISYYSDKKSFNLSFLNSSTPISFTADNLTFIITNHSIIFNNQIDNSTLCLNEVTPLVSANNSTQSIIFSSPYNDMLVRVRLRCSNDSIFKHEIISNLVSGVSFADLSLSSSDLCYTS